MRNRKEKYDAEYFIEVSRNIIAGEYVLAIAGSLLRAKSVRQAAIHEVKDSDHRGIRLMGWDKMATALPHLEKAKLKNPGGHVVLIRVDWDAGIITRYLDKLTEIININEPKLTVANVPGLATSVQKMCRAVNDYPKIYNGHSVGPLGGIGWVSFVTLTESQKNIAAEMGRQFGIDRIGIAEMPDNRFEVTWQIASTPEDWSHFGSIAKEFGMSEV